MKALHVISCKYVGPRGFAGSKLILRSERFKQSKSMAINQAMRDSLHQAYEYLKANGFDPIGTGEGKDCMYIVCNNLKPLKAEKP